MSSEYSSSAPFEDPRGPDHKKAPWLLRVFLRLVIIFLLLFTLLISAGFVIAFYYQDEVKGYIVTELNKQLNTQVIVDGKDIDFTVIKSFPYGSVNFKNVKALDAVAAEKKDTLFKVGEISLLFNVLDIFKKNYRVRKIQLKDVDVRIRINKKGEDNYHFWKESSDTASTSFSFALEDILLENIHLDYRSSKAKQKFEATVKESRLSGAFSAESYSLSTNADIFVDIITADSVSFLRKKNIHTEFSLAVDNKINSYKIESGKIKIEELLFEVYGNYISSGEVPVMNLGVKGKDMDIKSVLSLIPNKFKGKINDYESDGEFYFSALIQGGIGNGFTPVIKAEFGVRSADITQIRSNVTFKDVNLKGHYTNGDRQGNIKPSLQLLAMSAKIGNGSIGGELKISDLDRMSFSGHLTAITDLAQLQEFMQVDTIESVNGGLNIDAEFSCEGYSEKTSYENVLTSGDMKITDASIKLKNNSLEFKELGGEFKFDNNDLAVKDFNGKISGSDFILNGSFRNLIGFFLKADQDISIEADLRSMKLDLNEILSNRSTGNETGSESKYQLKFSDHIDVILNSEIRNLSFRKFNATDIKGVVKLKDKKMILDPITLSTMNGTITTSGLIDGSDSAKLLITCISDVNKINISKLFESFENFGQTTITDKNIKGVASAKIQFASVLSPDLRMDPDKLYAAVDMNIDNGELNNVESMKSLSKFISLKELENIRFATLKNQIEIKNQVISIPKMEIRSNALNVTLSGTHKFNNDIDYRIKLSLNELLAKKAKAAKKENDEFGEVADDGLGRTNIFLRMTGNLSDPQIKYDSKSAIQNVKEDLKVEKQNLKSILKEEFGLFKSDSTLKNSNNAKKEDQTKFRIDWEEADKKTEKKELKHPKKEEEDDF